MKTNPIYLDDPYLRNLEARIVSYKRVSDSRYELELDTTIFYPEGGGQPCDKGLIKGKEYEFRITNVKLIKGEIIHFATTNSNISPNIGDNVSLEIDFGRRLHNMKIHTMGHLIDFAITKLYGNKEVTPLKGEHGKNPYIIYKTTLELDTEKITKEIDKIIKNNLDISWKFVEYSELKEKANWLPEKLPHDKPLRMVTMVGYGSVADGGTLLHKTGEVGSYKIIDIKRSTDHITISYNISTEETEQEGDLKKYSSAELKSKIDKIDEDFKNDITNVSKIEDMENLEVKYLGRKSELVSILRCIKDLSDTEKPEIGKLSNILKNELESGLNTKKDELKKQDINTKEQEAIDVTLPSRNIKLATIHPITQMKWKTEEIFQKMGFEIITPYELDDDYHTFTTLNMPKTHPARDLWDTFWTEEGFIPITHTSAMQNRILKSIKPPIRAIVPGKCFRHEATDATHEFQFYQVEGVYVDKGITFTDMVGTLQEFMNNFFEKDVEMAASVFSKSNEDKIETRIQPSYFPFVEPAIEIMIKWKIGDSYKWLEVIPCGPIHPEVLKAGGLDPEVYSGFAWGFGLERLIMIKYGIEDLRNFHSADLRFLKQFI